MFTPYHSKYAAYDLTKLAPPGSEDQLSMSLFDASVDLNPHQIEAAMFALQSPLAEGAILADEVGLGGADGVHVGVNALAGMDVGAVERHALPLGQRMNDLRVCVRARNIESVRAFQVK